MRKQEGNKEIIRSRVSLLLDDSDVDMETLCDFLRLEDKCL